MLYEVITIMNGKRKISKKMGQRILEGLCFNPIEIEAIINSSKEKAKKESAKIVQEGEAKLSEINSKIDAGFDEAVRQVVSTVLKA